MRRSANPRFFASLALLAFTNACALASKGEALSPRYFSPDVDPVSAERPSDAATPPGAAPRELRLGQVDAAAHLEERMAYRPNPSELGYYDDRRWSEEPAAFLRRALAEELFERRKIHRVVSGAAPVLDVELTAFEELRGPKPGVRLALSFTLRDEREATLERRIVVERPLPSDADGDRPRAIAATLGEALAAVVAQVSEEVARHLPPPPPPPCVAAPAADGAAPAAAP